MAFADGDLDMLIDDLTALGSESDLRNRLINNRFRLFSDPRGEL
jgi:hypothetical protein